MGARLFAACIAAIAALSCGGGASSIEVSAPSAVKCQVTVGNEMTGNAPPVGATGSLGVTTTRDCTWTASSAVSWITFTTDASGQGSGTIGYRVAANGDASIRRGSVEVNNAQVTIVQDPAPCTFTVTPASVSVPDQGGTMTETIQTLTGCAWSASIPVDWIRMTEHSSGNGSGAVTFSVAANAGSGRSSNVVVAGKTVVVQQAGSGDPAPPPPPAPEPPPSTCSYALGSSSENVGPDNATIFVAVTTRSDCPWTATSHVGWITVASGASGEGDGTVALRVAGNGGSSRSGTVTVAGRTFLVNQAGAPCTYSIAADRQSVPPEGGNGTVDVTAGSTCSWNASSNVSWITITSGNSGAGNGTVAFTVAANATGGARTGSLNIAGRTFTVNQPAQPAPPPCTISIAPGSQSVSETGGTGSVSVTASAATCAWTATSKGAWITVTSGASGTGNGRVEYSIASNTGGARTGAVAIGDQTFTVTQSAASAPCTWTIAPTSQNVSDTGGSGSAIVTASAATCAWSATSNADWITLVSGSSGVGNGTVSFSVAPNTGAARTGTLTVASQTFTISQTAPPPPCTFSISPTFVTAPAEGLTGTVAITASAPSCAWSATSTLDWVAFAAPASGTGSATIGYTVAPNSAAARGGAVTIAGQAFTVSQGGQ